MWDLVEKDLVSLLMTRVLRTPRFDNLSFLLDCYKSSMS